ncbi:MAG: oxygen-independent coproporphyrinogen III oxidase [Bradymonadaceae bacterium]|nr:oxygen-independent coproporphyrinogen III oxidase [Lujinxingiaceae bacterium]
MSVDLDLIRKYNVPGPRYTSYPTAPHFSEDINGEAVRAAVSERSESLGPLSLYFHIPFCETLCWYCGCTTVIGKNKGQTEIYLDHLCMEIEKKARGIHPEREVVQLHFGGGSPTFLTPDEIRRLGQCIADNFRFSPFIEAAVEVDPRRLTREHVEALAEAGFNRASIGVQDNDPKVQKAVNRFQPMAITEQAIGWLREVGIESINIDLIYGLPYQSVESFARTLEEVLTLEPDRFAIYSYAHVPWIKPSQKILERHNLPSAEVKLALQKLTIEKLTASGYLYIGMDHYAKADNELARAWQEGSLQRNFQGYSTFGGADIYGFGMSSISQIGDVYVQNAKLLEDYYAAVRADDFPVHKACLLSIDDQLRRETIMRLMCDTYLDFDELSEHLGVDFRTYFARELASLDDMVEDALILVDPHGITVTDQGRLLLRNIAMRFDAYLQHAQPAGFSRTI